MSLGLPNYKGNLGPAPWSFILLSEPVKENLRRAALKNCPDCAGAGYRSAPQGAYPCHCASRPPTNIDLQA